MNKNIGDMTRSELIDYVIELQEENSGYERKIDKAVEYLGINEEILETCEIYDVNGIEVYKILKGEDNDTN